jgi:hypothetical protein
VNVANKLLAWKKGEPKSSFYAFRCAEAMTRKQVRGYRKHPVLMILPLEWHVTKKMIKQVGLKTILETPPDMRGIRFGWKRRDA